VFFSEALSRLQTQQLIPAIPVWCIAIELGIFDHKDSVSTLAKLEVSPMPKATAHATGQGHPQSSEPSKMVQASLCGSPQATVTRPLSKHNGCSYLTKLNQIQKTLAKHPACSIEFFL